MGSVGVGCPVRAPASSYRERPQISVDDPGAQRTDRREGTGHRRLWRAAEIRDRNLPACAGGRPSRRRSRTGARRPTAREPVQHGVGSAVDYGVSAWELRSVLLRDVVGASTVNARNHNCPASHCGQASTLLPSAPSDGPRVTELDGHRVMRAAGRGGDVHRVVAHGRATRVMATIRVTRCARRDDGHQVSSGLVRRRGR